MYRICKVLNHNGVIALDMKDNKEYVLLGKGVGFGKKVGERMEQPEECTVYSLQETSSRGAASELARSIEPEYLEMANQILNRAREQFGTIDQSILFPMADHIAFAVQRLQKGEKISNPLTEDIKTLFHSEFKVASMIQTILKEEKALMLYGGGANGKSVFFEIVNALLGAENVICHSLQDLTDGSGYYRAQLANKLVNYASEINGKLESSIFKQLVSGEPVSARLPYGKPFHLTHYARLIFNCNELPRGNEFTDAYFRRFLIVPFDVTIPPEEQIKDLHSRIIENELAGVFNWVLRGLARLLKQNGFTECIAARRAVEDYRLQSDSLRQFLNDERYKSDVNVKTKIVDLYIEYKYYCQENGFYHLTKPNFIKRLKSYGIQVSTINVGNVAYLKKHNSDEE